MVRLQVHPPGSQHPASLGLLPRTGGSCIIYDPISQAVCLCRMARFPISGGTKPSSTCVEACTILLALFHARRTLHHTWTTITPPPRTPFPRCIDGTRQVSPGPLGHPFRTNSLQYGWPPGPYWAAAEGAVCETLMRHRCAGNAQCAEHGHL